MKRLAVPLLLGLAACAPSDPATQTSRYLDLTRGTPVTLTAADRDAVKTGLRLRLKDPESAVFGPMAGATGANGQFVVCGYVNARNSFGGYTGDQLFLSEKTGNIFFPMGVASDDFEHDAYLEECRFAGVAI